MNITQLVDRLAAIKASMAELSADKAAVEAALIHLGAGRYDGTAHRVTVSACDGPASVDWRAVAEHFNPSRQLVTAHTAVGDPYYTVRLFGRVVDEQRLAA